MTRVTFGFKRDDGSLIELVATVERDDRGNVAVRQEGEGWESLSEAELARACRDAWPEVDVFFLVGEVQS